MGSEKEVGMKIEKGMLLRVQTRTKEDVFGECLYEVVEVGMDTPDTPKTGVKDGVTCKMLGGSGPAARKGFIVKDCEAEILRNIREGVTSIVPDDQRDAIVAQYDDKAKDGTPRKVKHGGAGVVEID
jgi:hypothetical protein